MRNKNQQIAVLLYSDHRRIDAQKEFNENLVEELSGLVKSFHSIGIDSDFSLADFGTMTKGRPEDLIRAKVSSKMNDVQFGGIKVSPSKAAEMLEIETGDFSGRFDKVQKLIRDSVIDSRSRGTSLIFDTRFFDLVDRNVTLNDKYFNEWVKSTCEVYTENDEQIKIHNTLNVICESLNALKEIKRSYRADNSNFSRMTTEKLKSNPKTILNEELEEMINYVGGKFVINYQFVTLH